MNIVEFNWADFSYYNVDKRTFVMTDKAELTIAQFVELKSYVEVDYNWDQHSIQIACQERDIVRKHIGEYVISTLPERPTQPESDDIGARIEWMGIIGERVRLIEKTKRLIGPNKF